MWIKCHRARLEVQAQSSRRHHHHHQITYGQKQQTSSVAAGRAIDSYTSTPVSSICVYVCAPVERKARHCVVGIFLLEGRDQHTRVRSCCSIGLALRVCCDEPRYTYRRITYRTSLPGKGGDNPLDHTRQDPGRARQSRPLPGTYEATPLRRPRYFCVSQIIILPCMYS